MLIYSPKIIYLPSQFDFDAIFEDQIQNSSAKLAFFCEERLYHEFTYKFGKTGFMMKDRLYSTTGGVSLIANNFFLRLLEKGMRNLIPSGIPQHSMEYHSAYWIRRLGNFKKNPQVLKIEDLSFGFLIWIGSCGISVAVFMLETINVQLRKFLQLARGLLGVLISLKLFIRKFQNVK